MPKIQADAFLTDPPDEILRAPSILIAGDETYLIDKVLAVILERVFTVAGAEAFDLDRRDAVDIESAEFESLVSTMPLMNDRRIVLLKGVQELSAETRDRVKAVLAESSGSMCLIGTGGAAIRGNLYSLWEKHGARIVCELPRKSPRSKQVDFDFERWLTTRARVDFGKTLTPAAAAALAESGAELQPLYGELEKAALYVGDHDVVDRQDVEAVCLGGAMATVWEWCDAVGARDTDRALELLGHLMEAGESAYRLLPLLATHFCRLGIVVGLKERDPQSIMKALPGRSWYAMARGLADQSRHHTRASVTRALDRLGKADRMLKSTGHREEFVMHKHLIEVLDDV